MKNKLIQSTFLALFVLSLSACAPIQTTQQAIHILSSKGVLFSNVTSSKSKKGTLINGNIRKNASASKQIKIAGHIHILLKSKENKVLEIIKARTHRKYANSRLWHFDGVLKTSLPVGSVIIVKYH